MTYNILYGRHVEDGFDKILRFLEQEKPDLLFLQETKWRLGGEESEGGEGSEGGEERREFADERGHPASIARALGGAQWVAVDRKGYDGSKGSEGSEGGWSRGPAIVTRGRIVRHESVAVDNGAPFAVLAEIELDGQRIVAVSAHFRSVGGATVGGVASTEPDRVLQAKALLVRLKNETRPIVVGCDLNSLPFFPTYNEMTARFRDAAMIHYDASYTRKTHGLPARIDYLFLSDGWRAERYEVPAVDFSDHRPVTAGIRVDVDIP
jgi:endonuclease/exonuclease/phosphatase family metal-dependent hydrolase